ncbi:MmcQ/YjbR family DNA-binding protein [Paenibacillus protaetiae]|uniref:MmcQ/YjbR family DNA-binding protein n=1 Tax=Paenibacillus protaetiae TaxID=2509456 RepID=A0A4P6F303_9BACL|nr:MmcQ/YjbR family DNA-binding protein [Paenibacillus protaetiae]QAY68539.1 MmcQ/YjbR family DNA-binding protein [Paenibacillus protaetiae]
MFEEWASYCLSRKGAVKDYPFGLDPLVMKVGGKMFALLSEAGGQVHISLKCEPEMAELLRSQHEAVVPGYHLNKRHWNTVTVNGSLPEEEVRWMIDHSYALVVKSLTKAVRESIG